MREEHSQVSDHSEQYCVVWHASSAAPSVSATTAH